MPLDHAADPGEAAEPYLDALADVCDCYDVDVESAFVEREVLRTSSTRVARDEVPRTVRAGCEAVKPPRTRRLRRLPAREQTGSDDPRAAPLDPVGRVHYLTAGDGPPLLALHGLGATAATWVPAFDALTDRFTVYAPERPGRGLSTPVDYRETGFRAFGVEYVAAFLDAVGVERTAVLGNSLGGFQALALALDHPQRVDRLCTIGAPAGLSRSIPLVFRLLDLPVLGGWLFDYFRAESVADARRALRQIDVDDDAALPDAYFRPGLVGEDLPGRRESLRSLMETLATWRGMYPRFDLREAVPEIETPTRFVWGTEDYFWPPSVGRPVAGAMANADFVTLPDHGHTPWLEPGDEAIDAAAAFLAGEVGPVVER